MPRLQEGAHKGQQWGGGNGAATALNIPQPARPVQGFDTMRRSVFTVQPVGQKMKISGAQRGGRRDLPKTQEAPAELTEAGRWKGTWASSKRSRPKRGSLQQQPPGSPCHRSGMARPLPLVIIFCARWMRWCLLNLNLLRVASHLAHFSAENKIYSSTNTSVLTLLPESMLVTILQEPRIIKRHL